MSFFLEKCLAGNLLFMILLIQNNLTHGAFIVAYFDAPKLPQIARPKWPSIEEARTDLKNQATLVNGDEKLSVVVRSLVVDARLH